MYGSAADQCIGLEVVLSDGKIIKTGSWATPHKPSPFFRTYGPDLTGLFLGDTGSLGFKTKIVLKLIPMPKYVEFASFAFNNYKEIVMAMSEISRRGIAAECFGFDPYLQGQRLKRQGLLTDFKRLVNAPAQIDDLTRNIPQQNNISKQDFGVLNYLDAFKDDSIQRIAINLKEQEINIRLEGLPPLKLNLLKQILKSEELNFIESDLIEKDEGFFGNLLVQYET